MIMMFLAPIFAIFVFGLAFSGDIKDVSVVIVNEDQGFSIPFTSLKLDLPDTIISNLDTKILAIKHMQDADSAIAQVKNGRAYAAIVFGKNFTSNMLQKSTNPRFKGSAEIKIFVDKSNVNVAAAITKSFSDAMLTTIKARGQDLPVSIVNEAIYGKNAKFMDFFVPGVMAFVVYLLTTLLTLISFVSEKTTGTLERLMATPLKPIEIVSGFALAFSLVGVLQTCLLLLVGILGFNITIVGNVLLSFAVIALLAIVCQSLGILLSSLARNEMQAVQFLPFIVLPAFLLAGIFWPIEAIPVWLRPLSYIVPPTYAVDACRSIMIRGWGFDKTWFDFLALFGFAVVFLLLATLSLKRYKR